MANALDKYLFCVILLRIGAVCVAFNLWSGFINGTPKNRSVTGNGRRFQEVLRNAFACRRRRNDLYQRNLERVLCGRLVLRLFELSVPLITFYRRNFMSEVVSQSEPVVVQKKSYITPTIAECNGMTFTKAIWGEMGSESQFQCFHCNCSNH